MDPLLPLNPELTDPEADLEEEERKKIQFSVPSTVTPQLDPRQVEMIRRRRPTPATLFRLTDPPSPEEDPQQWVLTDHGVLKSRVTHTYQPPSLKVVQKMAQAHLACLPSMDKDDSDEEVEKDSEVHQKTKEPQGDVQRLQDRSEESHQPTGEKEPWDNGSF
ncbi:protein phosphatase 1 regulatory subunit 1B-like [Boleophthalmus pectinirostris]|uniref:protein phosphatase 1 regulatory subunit 1B-like n=1 Tax=Boleophthalmus pectinirostris TaxID=150288 RepID=UPI000A1C3621|nr:protein phosphatase 1 regulatory subunit 1B-like [Boleophthalmus pectinirostris]